MNEPVKESKDHWRAIRMADRTENKALITCTIRLPGEDKEWGAAEYFDPDEMDLNEIFETLRLAFERAFKKSELMK